MTIKVTDEMVQAFSDGDWRDEEVRPRLAAVLALIDPVPDGVRIIRDDNQVVWERHPYDPMVWIDRAGLARFYTAGWIDERYGPITWTEPSPETVEGDPGE